jgi:hypothetical protein
MKAVKLIRDRMYYDDGAILEMTIWKVPTSVSGSAHVFKYRLFYGYPGQRLVCYDNERGKGDHCHFEEREEPYIFQTVEALIEDFLADVKRLRGEL